MNTIEELIQKECPEGVEYLPLGEVCRFQNGFAFKSSLFKPSGDVIIRITNICNNIVATDDVKYFDKNDYAKIDLTPFLIKKGDILVAMSGATTGKIGIYKNDSNAYLNQRVGKFLPKKEIDNSFLYHFLSSKTDLMYIIAGGGAQPNLSSNKLLEMLEIPVPPLSVQHKIVEILDKFTSLEAELQTKLQAELEARKKQYEYYRNQLLDFTGREDVEWKTLGECGDFIRGGGLQKKDFTETGFPCIHYGQIHTRFNTHTNHTVAYTSVEYASKLKKAQPGDLLIATTSEDVDACCKAVTWLGNTEVAVSGDMYIYHHNQNPRYMSHLFRTKQFSDYKKTVATGAKVVRVSGESMAKFKFAFPSLSEQEKIANTLDKFEALINDQTASLAAEIKARHQQYEYYRDKLLSFKRKDS